MKEKEYQIQMSDSWEGAKLNYQVSQPLTSRHLR